MRQSQRDFVTVWNSGDAGADGKDRALIMEQHINDTRHRAADAIVSCALAGDDLVGGPSHILVDLPSMRPCQRLAVNSGKVIEAQSRDGSLGPGQHFGISMFSQYVGVNVL